MESHNASIRLCRSCSLIPPSFWYRSINGGIVYETEANEELSHKPYPAIRESSARGCPLCKAISVSVTEWAGGGDVPSETSLQICGATWPPGSFTLKCGSDEVGRCLYRSIDQRWVESTPVPDVKTDDYFAFIQKRWLLDCVKEHPDCAAPHGLNRPTRVLRVRSVENEIRVNLVDAVEISSEFSYVALSHCWGHPSRRPLITTQDNIDEHRASVPFHRLAVTFRDACHICLKLDIEYVWIDSLCIIQDSFTDWEYESAIMGDIYAMAYCTLAASSSPDGYWGCRVNAERDLESYDPASGRISHTDILIGDRWLRFFPRGIQDWLASYNEGPLRERAWTLQERYLSRRILHFSRNVLMWECKSLKATNQLPWGIEEENTPTKRNVSLLRDSEYETSNNCPSVVLRSQWFSIVSDFSQRLLTKGTDRLPALAGLARRFSQDRVNYAAGLWREDFPSALLWRTGVEQGDLNYASMALNDVARRPDKYRAPSWSWASIESNITYSALEISGPSPVVQESRAAEYDFVGLEIKELSVNTGTNPFGAVGSAILHVDGLLKVATLDMNQATALGGVALIDINKDVIGMLYVDVPGELSNGSIIYCLAVRREQMQISKLGRALVAVPVRSGQPESMATVMGLALSPIPKSMHTYQRIGLFRWLKKIWFDNTPTSSIRIQ